MNFLKKKESIKAKVKIYNGVNRDVLARKTTLGEVEVTLKNISRTVKFTISDYEKSEVEKGHIYSSVENIAISTAVTSFLEGLREQIKKVIIESDPEVKTMIKFSIDKFYKEQEEK